MLTNLHNIAMTDTVYMTSSEIESPSFFKSNIAFSSVFSMESHHIPTSMITIPFSEIFPRYFLFLLLPIVLFPIVILFPIVLFPR